MGEGAVLSSGARSPQQLDPQRTCSVRARAGQYHRGRDCVPHAGMTVQREAALPGALPREVSWLLPNSHSAVFHTTWQISLERCYDVTSNSCIVLSMMAAMTLEGSTLELHVSPSLLPDYLVQTSTIT